MPSGAAGLAPNASAAPATRPYGRIAIYTLLEDRVADFDRLAEQSAEEVRIREPDTLVYVIHLVPKAPMQRIFYEVYRDRAAFDRHERQPYMQRFVAERRSCVLATNVIELRLKYAKVSPLPQSQAPTAAQVRPQLPPPPQSPSLASQPLKPQAPQPPVPQPPKPQPPKPQPQPQQLPAPGRRYGGI
jgi:quinol monooxygenase YgiN